tara:strand:+ start:4184 stop:4723 length:540 start_codon:yes stop_codon:yes gene_type:complete
MKLTPLLLLVLAGPASAGPLDFLTDPSRLATATTSQERELIRHSRAPYRHVNVQDSWEEPRSSRPWWKTATYQPGYSSSSTCTRKEYREEYVPGTARRPGYVKNWHDTIEVPCNRPVRPSVIRPRTPSPDGNECIEGSVLGGILGGGAAAAMSQGDGRWWAIPLGIVGGSMIGCDIDGG